MPAIRHSTQRHLAAVLLFTSAGEDGAGTAGVCSAILARHTQGESPWGVKACHTRSIPVEVPELGYAGNPPVVQCGMQPPAFARQADQNRPYVALPAVTPDWHD